VDQEVETRPLIINDIRSPQLKRKHLNPDCTHLVPIDFQTVIDSHSEDFFRKSHSAPGDKSFKTWIFQVFWSTSKRKKLSIIGVFAFSCVIIAASGYYLFQRQPKLQAAHSN
jgi:hypothetical protein